MVRDRSFFGTSEVMIATVSGIRHVAEFRGPDEARHMHDVGLWAISSSQPGS